MIGFPDPVGIVLVFILFGAIALVLWPFMKAGEKIVGRGGRDTTTPENSDKVVYWALGLFFLFLIIYSNLKN